MLKVKTNQAYNTVIFRTNSSMYLIRNPRNNTCLCVSYVIEAKKFEHQRHAK